MGEDHRGLADLQRGAHGLIGDMREVHHHAQAIHLAHNFFAERGQAVMLGLVAGGIGPIGVLGVRQRHVTRAERVGHAQHGQRVVDRVAAFHADERGDLPLAMNPLDVGGRQRQFERVGIMRHHLMDHVNLLEHRLHRGRPGGDGGDIHRPELGADAPSRRRGMSVTSGGLSLPVSRARSIALKSLLRLRYCHGRSLWPSMSGTSRSSWRTSARVAGSGFGTVSGRRRNRWLRS